MNYLKSFAFSIFVGAWLISAAAAEPTDELNARIAQATTTQTDNSSAFHTEKKQRLNLLFEQIARAGDPDEAAAYERAIWQTWLRSGNEEVDQLMRQALSAMARTKYRDALATLDKIVNRLPDFAEGWNKRATVLYLLGFYQSSLADIDKVLALEPRHFGAISGIALIRIELGDNEAAVEAVQRALKIHPHLPGAAQLLERAGGVVKGETSEPI